MTDAKKRAFIHGARDSIALVLAAAPFGMVYGALGHAQGLPDWLIISISLFVFAGASQFIAITLMATGASHAIIIATVFVLNLRHLLYAVSLLPFVKSIPQALRLPMGFSLTDETFAVVYRKAVSQPDDPDFAWYFLGSSGLMYTNWQLCTWIGVIAGNQFPALTEFGLDVAMVIAFVGIVVPQIKLPSHLLCALTAVVCAVLTYHWPNQLGLLVSSVLAILVGVITEKRFDKPAGEGI